MNLRERRNFVNYVDTRINIRRRPKTSPMKNRKRSASDGCENQSDCNVKKQEKAPNVKRRATFHSNVPANNQTKSSKGRSVSVQRPEKQNVTTEPTPKPKNRARASQSQVLENHSETIKAEPPIVTEAEPIMTRLRSRSRKPENELTEVPKSNTILNYSPNLSLQRRSRSTRRPESTITANFGSLQKRYRSKSTVSNDIKPNIPIRVPIESKRQPNTFSQPTPRVQNMTSSRLQPSVLNSEAEKQKSSGSHPLSNERRSRSRKPCEEATSSTSINSKTKRCSRSKSSLPKPAGGSGTTPKKPSRSTSARRETVLPKSESARQSRTRSCAHQRTEEIIQHTPGPAKTTRSKSLIGTKKEGNKSSPFSRKSPEYITIASSSKTIPKRSQSVGRGYHQQLCEIESEKFDDEEQNNELSESEDEEEDSESDVTSDEDDSQRLINRKSRNQISVDIDNIDRQFNGDFNERSSREVATSDASNPPLEFFELRTLWAKISTSMSRDKLFNYKKTLIKILTGRLSCLRSTQSLFPDLPNDLVKTHNRLYNLLCQSSGAYPFKNHEGTKLVSQHTLADTTQIGAQIMIECLDKNILPYGILTDSTLLTQIETYVRIGIKDIMQELVEQLPADRKKITVDDIQESLSSKLLK